MLANGYNRKVHLNHLHRRAMVPDKTLVPDETLDVVACKDIPYQNEGDDQHHLPRRPTLPSITIASGISGTSSKDLSIPHGVCPSTLSLQRIQTSEPVDQSMDQPSHILTRAPNISRISLLYYYYSPVSYGTGLLGGKMCTVCSGRLPHM